MILPIVGIHTNMPSRYEDIVERLRALGLVPTGNEHIDKMRLRSAIDKKVEALEEQQKIQKEREKSPEEKLMMEEKIGAQILAEQNRFFFNL